MICLYLFLGGKALKSPPLTIIKNKNKSTIGWFREAIYSYITHKILATKINFYL